MPAVSKDQRVAMAIAEHRPGQLYARNKGLLKMSRSQLHDFAATKEKGLPRRVSRSSETRSQTTHKGPQAPLKVMLRARKQL